MTPSGETQASPVTGGNCGVSIRLIRPAPRLYAWPRVRKTPRPWRPLPDCLYCTTRCPEPALGRLHRVVDLAQETGLPVFLCGDNDEVGREAMRKVRRLLFIDHHLDVTKLTGPETGSVADLPKEDLLSLIRVEVSDRDPRWQKPLRSRAQYLEYKCPRPKRNIKGAGDLSLISGSKSCGNTGNLPRVLRMGELPTHRAVLARSSSADDRNLWIRRRRLNHCRNDRVGQAL